MTRESLKVHDIRSEGEEMKSTEPPKPCPGGSHHCFQSGKRICNCGKVKVPERKRDGNFATLH